MGPLVCRYVPVGDVIRATADFSALRMDSTGRADASGSPGFAESATIAAFSFCAARGVCFANGLDFWRMVRLRDAAI